MIAEYPVFDRTLVNEDIEGEMKIIMEVSRAIRNIRSEMNISPAKRLDAVLRTEDENKLLTIQRQNLYISELAKLQSLSAIRDGKEPKLSATAVVEGMEIFVLLEGVIDIQEEKNRLNRELKKINGDIIFLNKRLSNEDFISRAPKEVIEKDKEKYETLVTTAKKIQENFNRLLD